MKRSPLAAAALLVAAALLARAGPASAHEGEATMAVTATEPVDERTVRYAVRLTYVNDGHGVPDATVTAVAEHLGEALPPAPLTPLVEEGDYEVVLEYPEPGEWSVRFTSVTPVASATATSSITSAAGAATTTATTATSATTEPPEQASEAPVDSGAIPTPAGSADDDQDSLPGTLVFVGLLVALAVVGALAVTSVRRAEGAGRRGTGRPLAPEDEVGRAGS